MLEIINPCHRPDGRIKAAVFDFDGTISALRRGWEAVMRTMMLEFIPDSSQEIDEYIEESTGIQTIYQMRWLSEKVTNTEHCTSERDEWWYKAEYNRRLMVFVDERLRNLSAGESSPHKYLIQGAVDFLKALRDAGISIYLASGTDHCNVLAEAAALGVDKYFTVIKGAPEHTAACSKEKIINMLLEEQFVKRSELLIVGDGKIEIALGAEAGAYTLGVATDEEKLSGVNPVKRERLIRAGADAVCGDFCEIDVIKNWIGI